MTSPREIFDCARVRSYLESYLIGQVPPPEARAIRLHFTRCDECWSRVVARDPLQVFSPLAEEDRDDAFWAGFWPAVRAGIHESEGARRGFWSGLLRPSIAWSAAAALLVVAVLALTRPWSPDPAHVPEPARAGRPSPDVVRADQDWPAAALTGGAPALPTVEEVRSPTAQVLNMKVYGEGQRVTEVVLIVDAEVEL